MQDQSSLMHFPCDFPMKIIGKSQDKFLENIIEIVCCYFPETGSEKFKTQASKNANYVSVSVMLYVTEQSILDELYLALTKHPDISMVL